MTLRKGGGGGEFLDKYIDGKIGLAGGIGPCLYG